MFGFHQLIKKDKPDLIFGNTSTKYIARDEDIPLIRMGFPIYDRVGHQYFPITGYRGPCVFWKRSSTSSWTCRTGMLRRRALNW
jgi:nitrogenase molybdenum-iron protein alpha/beta subunit